MVEKRFSPQHVSHFLIFAALERRVGVLGGVLSRALLRYILWGRGHVYDAWFHIFSYPVDCCQSLFCSTKLEQSACLAFCWVLPSAPVKRKATTSSLVETGRRSVESAHGGDCSMSFSSPPGNKRRSVSLSFLFFCFKRSWCTKQARCDTRCSFVFRGLTTWKRRCLFLN